VLLLQNAALADAMILASCTVNIGYPEGGSATPKATLLTPYVLAVADFRDRRVQRDGEEEDQPRWGDLYAPPERLAPFPPAITPPPLVGDVVR